MKKILIAIYLLTTLSACGYYPIENGDLGTFFEGPIAPVETKESYDPCKLPPWKTRSMPECQNNRANNM